MHPNRFFGFLAISGLALAAVSCSDGSERSGGERAAQSASATASPTLVVTPTFRAPGDDRLIISRIALDAPISLHALVPDHYGIGG